MANFSTIMLMEQARGPQARIEFCKRIEDQYGERRQVDSERPMVRINERRAGDTTVMYDKGSWVFWMLQQLMGRDANLEGLQDFVATWSQSPDHPVLQDFVATMRPHAPDPDAFDAFVKQWLFDVVIPEYRIESAESQAEGGGWVVTATVENVGSGRMPVEVAAAKGDRFVEQTEEQAAHEIAAFSPDYRDARALIVLGAGEKTQVRLRCDFEPDRIEIDPDALVLQLKRKNAVAKL
jgi:aminopeptidase N